MPAADITAIPLALALAIATVYTRAAVEKVCFREAWLRKSMEHLAKLRDEPPELQRRACEAFLERSVPYDLGIAMLAWFGAGTLLGAMP